MVYVKFSFYFKVIVAEIQGVFDQNASWIFQTCLYEMLYFPMHKKNYSWNRFSECFILFLGDES